VSETDWGRVAGLYAVLALLTRSPIVELNRAVAVSMAYGAQAGLDAVEPLRCVPALSRYHRLPAVRGDLLARLGRLDEARHEFERAASMTQNQRERALLLDRAVSTRANR
jgi:predicted RNA polymerase sigma factor